ncbi:hypothetical protein CIB48_g10164 [Xylaria polymorpha]|nr:hypothetical protein CIB48_g10164 [Xylaria polymorpha]
MRDYILSLEPDDPERKQLIVHQANMIVEQPLRREFGLSRREESEWLNVGYKDPDGTGLDMNEEAFLESFMAFQSAWANDEDLDNLLYVLREHRTYLSNINKIVCFGLGSPQARSGVNVEDEPTEKFEAWCSACQYATALELANLFKEFNGGTQVQVFAQDPKLTLMEINAFPKLGITIVNPYLHEGFTLIDSNTFVFSVALNHEAKLKEIIMATSQPAGIVSSPNRDDRASRKAMRKEYAQVHCDGLGEWFVTYAGIENAVPLAGAKLFIRR